MTSAIVFPSITSAHSLPLLFPGQAQKEISINQSFHLLDALLQGCVDVTLDTPPIDPGEGSIFRIGTNASGEWAGKTDSLAILIGGAWNYLEPYEGLNLFDRSAGGRIHFKDGWQSVVEPSAPSGGTTIDHEARQVISEILTALTLLGQFKSNVI